MTAPSSEIAEDAVVELHRPRGGNLTARSASGLQWSYISAAGTALIQLGYISTMARLLTTAAFGVMAMAHIAVNLGNLVARMGVAHALMQRVAIDDRDIRASVTSGTALGAVCTGATYAAAPLLGDLYNEPSVVPVIRALSLTFVLLGVGATSQALLRRQMRFRELAIIEMGSALVGSVAGVGSALAGAGVYSLVVAFLTTTTLTFLLQYWRVRHSLVPLVSWRVLKPLYTFGARVSLLRVAEFLGHNLDTVAVGRYLASSAAGVYSRSYTLVRMPLSRYLAQASARVLFPSFSSIQGDPVRLRRSLSTVFVLAAALLLPVGAGMAVAAPELVATVLGSKFSGGAVLVPFFALAAVLSLLSHLAELMCESIADLNRTIALQAGHLALLVASLVVAASVGDTWMFAAALAFAEVPRHAGYLLLLRRSLDLGITDALSCYGPGVVLAACVALAVFGTRVVATSLDAPAPITLAFEIAAAAAAMVAGIRILGPPRLRREVVTRLGAVADSRHNAARPARRLIVAVLGIAAESGTRQASRDDLPPC